MLIALILCPFLSQAQTYKEWDDHDVIRFYKKITLETYSLDEEGEEIDEIFVPTKIADGVYKVEVYKISSELYQVQGSDIYMFFRYAPYLYNYDEGVLVVSYNQGTFYEEP